MLIHNQFLNNIQELQEQQATYSIKYTYLTTINKTIELSIDNVYYEICKYKVDIFTSKNNLSEIIILGYKELQYDCLDKEESDTITFIIDTKYKIHELKNSVDTFYKYVFEYLQNKYF